jgi:hypothetical protein
MVALVLCLQNIGLLISFYSTFSSCYSSGFEQHQGHKVRYLLGKLKGNPRPRVVVLAVGVYTVNLREVCSGASGGDKSAPAIQTVIPNPMQTS